MHSLRILRPAGGDERLELLHLRGGERRQRAAHLRQDLPRALDAPLLFLRRGDRRAHTADGQPQAQADERHAERRHLRLRAHLRPALRKLLDAAPPAEPEGQQGALAIHPLRLGPHVGEGTTRRALGVVLLPVLAAFAALLALALLEELVRLEVLRHPEALHLLRLALEEVLRERRVLLLEFREDLRPELRVVHVDCVVIRHEGGAREHRAGSVALLVRDARRRRLEDLVDVRLAELLEGGVIPLVDEDVVRASLEHRVDLGAVLRRPMLAILEPVVRSVRIHRSLEAELLVRSLHHLRLIRVAGHQPEDLHLAALPDAVRPRHGLHVILRVPIGVEDDARVRCGQVDPQAARARGEEEDECVRAGLAEAIDRRLPQVAAYRTVKPLVRVAALAEVVGEHVEHLHHL
mmetsp:Transcript_3158/g.7492  ORF Transcript_3158/g.7492 Transcript_3158/m.7492 type:complete len:407 (+) Transcript_3158:1050-2270(+)